MRTRFGIDSNGTIPTAVDAVVVGAGPAGCAASAYLSRAGRCVLLLDRGGVPRPRLCTHALMPAAIPVLEEMGVLGTMLDAGAQRWWGVRLTMEGTLIEARLPRLGAAVPYGISLRREYLDPILLNAAVRDGAEVRLGWEVVAPLVEGDSVVGVRVRSPGGAEHSVRSRIVVACDGRHSTLLSSVGHRSRSLPNRHFAWIAYVAGMPPEERPVLEAIYRNGRSVSLLPCDGGLRVAGVIVPGNRWTPREAGERMLATMRRFPELRGQVEAARVVTRPISVRGLRNVVRAAAVPGLVAAGDAAVQSDPAFGQGITWALRGARRLANLIDCALDRCGDGPLVIPASAAREPRSLPLLLGMSVFSAIPPGSTMERLLVQSAARAPISSTLALRVAIGFSTAADSGPARSPSTFLREVLTPAIGLPARRASTSV